MTDKPIVESTDTADARAERRRPEPGGQTGYLRVDSVHQGDDLDGVKGSGTDG